MGIGCISTEQIITEHERLSPRDVAIIFAIARNTFREHVRDRVFINLLLFALLMIGAALLLGELSAAQEKKIILDLGLSATLLIGTSIAILLGVGLVSKDVERRTLYTILARPITRTHFLLGKHLGLCATLAANVAACAVGLVAVLAWQGLTTATCVQVALASALIFLELTIIVSIAVLFSSFSTPALSALFSFAFVLIGHFNGELAELGHQSPSALARIVFNALYYLLPNFDRFASTATDVLAMKITGKQVFAAALYSLAYACALVAAAVCIFIRKDLK
ncbi:MAG: hypothetical protein C4334_12345 [Pyrinomonas sp.]|uniref:ABC transporter permease n=1 Tax=Pyrinomonas sp. TaxID=2080306 RepID=UPI0033263E74